MGSAPSFNQRREHQTIYRALELQVGTEIRCRVYHISCSRHPPTCVSDSGSVREIPSAQLIMANKTIQRVKEAVILKSDESRHEEVSAWSNRDLIPLPPSRRTWGWFNFFGSWSL